ncbi:cytochrome d ubiquinol oxidase subunit II [Ancylobacter defluvii]|uniref:Ubiquinol oxidase subunit II, cyanide insensitive n=1 Tax=Ancylobacter defluvii TaxID=1282440 RepID=A0A9W6N905_9HYPH|nr:cytochrome d ubiquinol oxidase subunit II [Ancylobacter defluvii]MBS7587403.1 cytochrome d ubiquinol oxidase subunit II [Ancylobacter defluvii]GLK82093.1 ubiquinol oxidase subunit II, cyanide insensitive [Ancylobacter defluvii]
MIEFMQGPYVPLAFGALAAFCVTVYVLADGLDLGVGIIFLAAPRDDQRDLMMASIEPVWDANETWLVMGGTLLIAAFPAGYYVLLPAFYLPIMFMLFALIFRGIAFEFRLQATRFRFLWDIAFSAGSILATLCQGLILGGLIGGVPMQDGMFSGGAFSFFSFLGLLCGVGLVGGYALIGAGWLIWRTNGATQVFAREIAHAALLLTAAMMALVSLWSALTVPEVAARWFALPNLLLLAPVPLATLAVFVAIWRGVWDGAEPRTFLLSLAVFALGLIGLVVSLWPYVVPRHITVWDGAADPQTLAFIAVGLVVILPIVLAYQAHAYWVFRGKTVHHGGYGGETLQPAGSARP